MTLQMQSLEFHVLRPEVLQIKLSNTNTNSQGGRCVYHANELGTYKEHYSPDHPRRWIYGNRLDPPKPSKWLPRFQARRSRCRSLQGDFRRSIRVQSNSLGFVQVPDGQMCFLLCVGKIPMARQTVDGGLAWFFCIRTWLHCGCELLTVVTQQSRQGVENIVSTVWDEIRPARSRGANLDLCLAKLRSNLAKESIGGLKGA